MTLDVRAKPLSPRGVCWALEGFRSIPGRQVFEHWLEGLIDVVAKGGKLVHWCLTVYLRMRLKEVVLAALPISRTDWYEANTSYSVHFIRSLTSFFGNGTLRKT